MVRVSISKRLMVFLGVWLLLSVLVAIFLALFGSIVDAVISGVFFHNKVSARMFLESFGKHVSVSYLGTFGAVNILDVHICCKVQGYLAFYIPLFILSFYGGFVLTESRMPLRYLINTPSRMVRIGPSGRFRVGEELNRTGFNIFEARKVPHPHYFGSLISNIFMFLVLLFAIYLIGLFVLIFIVALIGLLMDTTSATPISDEVPIAPQG
jgi:hypothetical protein